MEGLFDLPLHGDDSPAGQTPEAVTGCTEDLADLEVEAAGWDQGDRLRRGEETL